MKKGELSMKKIVQWILIIFLIPADLTYFFSKTMKHIIDKDIERYLNGTPYKRVSVKALNYLLIYTKAFRNIFYYRTRKSVILRNISKLFIRPLATIEIEGEIGEGFYIAHNYAVIHPEKAGKNLLVGHGVTIGKGSDPVEGRAYPVIGDNVSISTNAVVFGCITIGNNVRIGAGAVVNKDVPDNCTAVGNPFRIIKKEE